MHIFYKTLMALFPKLKVLKGKGLISRSGSFSHIEGRRRNKFPLFKWGGGGEKFNPVFEGGGRGREAQTVSDPRFSNFLLTSPLLKSKIV